MKFKSLACGVSLLIVELTLVANGYSQSFLTNGLVAYYPFDGNAHDVSGYGMNGQVNGATPTTNRFGLTESAYSFNGSSWIQLPDSVLPSTQSNLTMSAWVLLDGAPYTSQQDIYHNSSRVGEWGPAVQTGGELLYGFKLSNLSIYTVGTPVITNQWIQILATYQQGQNIQLWINGVLMASNAIPNYPLYTSPGYPLNSAFGIYDLTAGPYLGLIGQISDARFYNRALATNEIQQLYQYESTTPYCGNPQGATATAIVSNGVVVGTTITDPGCGYSNVPPVLILGGGGSGATAVATLGNGIVTSLTIPDGGSGYTNAPAIFIYSPNGLQATLLRAVQPAFSDLLPGTNYQLQVSGNMINWTNQGAPFTATNFTMSYPEYFNVDNWNQLFFRLQLAQ
jgi:hypothetical protein